MLVRSTLRYDFAVVLAQESRRITHYANCVRCVQTDATSQSTKRAARADSCSPLLAAPEIAATGHRLPRGTGCVFRREDTGGRCKGAFGQAAARLWGAEQRKACGLARSASCHLTRRTQRTQCA